MTDTATAPSYKKNKKKRKPKKITQSYLYNAGLFYLQNYTAGTEHFRRVMKRKIDRSLFIHKEPPEADCMKMLDHVIAEFQQLGYLDDRAYTRGMVQSFRNRGLPARTIRMKLKQKGISAELIEKALSEYDEHLETDVSTDLIAAAKFARKKKLGGFDQTVKKDAHDHYGKSLAKFARAGFSYDQASHIMRLSLEELEELLDLAR